MTVRLRRRRRVCAGCGQTGRQLELHTLRELAARERDPLAALLTEGAALHVEAHLRLFELADADASTLVADARAPRRSARPDVATRSVAG